MQGLKPSQLNALNRLFNRRFPAADVYTTGEDTAVQDKQAAEAVRAAQALIDALPDEVTADNAEEIEAQLIALDEALAALAKKIKNFALPVTGVSGFESAQVTAGGVRTAEFRADTLESRLAPGVFACGEVLDIDGDCGGYNLQWAWSSGYVAGMLGKQEEPR